MADAAAPQRRRLRILCLHGMGTSGAILTRQLRPLADAVAEVAELVHLDGQEECEPVRVLRLPRPHAQLLTARDAFGLEADPVIAKVFPGGPVRRQRSTVHAVVSPHATRCRRRRVFTLLTVAAQYYRYMRRVRNAAPPIPVRLMPYLRAR